MAAISAAATGAVLSTRLPLSLTAKSLPWGTPRMTFSESLLRNTLFTGRLSALPAVTNSRSGDVRLIRPLVYVSEEITQAYAEQNQLPITPWVYSFKTGTVRETLRGMLAQLKRENSHVMENMLAAMGRINTERLLDRRFLGGAGGTPIQEPVAALEPYNLPILQSSCNDSVIEY